MSFILIINSILFYPFPRKTTLFSAFPPPSAAGAPTVPPSSLLTSYSTESISFPSLIPSDQNSPPSDVPQATEQPPVADPSHSAVSAVLPATSTSFSLPACVQSPRVNSDVKEILDSKQPTGKSDVSGQTITVLRKSEQAKWSCLVGAFLF